MLHVSWIPHDIVAAGLCRQTHLEEGRMENEREKETEKDKERQREKETETETGKEREREGEEGKEREQWKEREKEKRNRNRDRDRETERGHKEALSTMWPTINSHIASFLSQSLGQSSDKALSKFKGREHIP